MTDSGFIVVRNWGRFQHYDPAKRTPPWVKNHTDLTSNDEYRRLPGGTRAVLHGLWIEYAKAHGTLTADTHDLSGRLALRVTSVQLERLTAAGFLDIVASKALALERYQLASASRARREAEAEEETPFIPLPRKPRSLGTNPRNIARVEAWIRNGSANHYPRDRLAVVIAEEFGIRDPDVVERLVEQVNGSA